MPRQNRQPSQPEEVNPLSALEAMIGHGRVISDEVASSDINDTFQMAYANTFRRLAEPSWSVLPSASSAFRDDNDSESYDDEDEDEDENEDGDVPVQEDAELARMLEQEYEGMAGVTVGQGNTRQDRFVVMNLVVDSVDHLFIRDLRNGYLFTVKENEETILRGGGHILFNGTRARNTYDPTASLILRNSNRQVRLAEQELRHFTDRQRQRQDADEGERNDQYYKQVQAVVQRIIEGNRNRPIEMQHNSMCSLCRIGIRTIDPHRSGVETEDGWVCERCYGTFDSCGDCGKMHNPDVLERTGHGRMCTNCITKRGMKMCEGCDVAYESENIRTIGDSQFCPDCYQINNQSMPRNTGEIWRRYQTRKLLALNSKDTGEIIKSSRVFSVEIECQYPSPNVFTKVSQILPRPLGVAHDGSISGSGVEFQTPKLSGKKGEAFINKVCGILNENHFTTDRTCGMHIHIDGAHDFTPMPSYVAFVNIKNLFAFHYVFEDVIASFLPTSRRRNTYCRRVTDAFSLRQILDTGSRRELESLWYRTEDNRDIMEFKSDRHHNSRYNGFNLHSLLSQNHLEIRFHSGTTSFKKMAEWVNLHLLIIDNIVTGKITTDHILNVRDFVKLEDKMGYMFDLIGLSDSSRQYFAQRVEKFGNIANRSLEESDLVMV